MSNPNANVRKFDGAVNAAAYWIYDHLLRAGDIVNDSTVTGTTVKAALNTLSAASTAVFPFTASGLAEQDLVSYDATAGTWKNRTVAAALSGKVTSTMVSNSSGVSGATVTAALNALSTIISGLTSTSISNASTVTGATVTAALNTLKATDIPYLATSLAEQDLLSYDAGSGVWVNRTKVAALKGTGTDSLVVGTGSLSAGTSDIILGVSSGNGSNTGSNNVGIGTDVLDGATVSLQDMVAIGNAALSGDLTAAANGCIGIGSNALTSLTNGSQNTAIGDHAAFTCVSGTKNTCVGSYALSGVSDQNTFIGASSGYSTVGSRNTGVGVSVIGSPANAVTDCVGMGYFSLRGALTTAASGAVGIGTNALTALTSGARNVCVGFQAGNILTIGSDMTILGYDADGDNAARSGCVVLGSGALATVNNTLVIRVGNSATTELKSTLAVTAGTGIAIGTEPYFTVIINGTSYKIALRT